MSNDVQRTSPNVSVRIMHADGCAFGYHHEDDTPLYGPIDNRGDVNLRDLTPTTPQGLMDWVGQEVEELAVDFNAFVVEKRYGKPHNEVKLQTVRRYPSIVTLTHYEDDWYLLLQFKNVEFDSIKKGDVPQDMMRRCMEWWRQHADSIRLDHELAQV